MHVDQKCWILKHFAAIINIVNTGTCIWIFSMSFERKIDCKLWKKSSYIGTMYMSIMINY